MILGSGRGVRHLDPTRSYPTALANVPGLGTVLSWTVGALEQAGVERVVFVGGYHIEKVVEAFPRITHYYHAEWERQGPVAAMALPAAEIAAADSVLLVPSDIVFRPEAVRLLEAEAGDLVAGDGGLVLARAPRLAELNGLARRLATADPAATIADLVAQASRGGWATATIKLGGVVASIRRPRDLASFVLGTKGETLDRLRPMVRGALIPEVHRFTVAQWQADRDGVLAEIIGRFGDQRLVVRSSSLLEDLWTSSGAGRFYSALDVAPSELAAEVERVIESYGQGAGDDQVLVQPYVHDAVVNGVLFTRHPDDGGPYLVLNYDQAEGRTDTVTAGASRRTRTRIRLRGGVPPASPGWQDRLLRLAAEVEGLVHLDSLDMEFAVDGDDRLHLFQVRPIALDTDAPFTDGDLRDEVESLRDLVRYRLGPTPTLLGRRGALGVMPDWNPAEIIGICPRPLALSLYRALITNETWAAARALIGYRSLESEPLVYALAGRPYVDVRASLNSLLPADLDDRIGAKAVEFGIERLRLEPHLHDKIEFELLPTVCDLDPGPWRRQYRDAGWPAPDVDAYFDSLRRLTDRIIRGEAFDTIAGLRSRLDALAAGRAALLADDGPSSHTFSANMHRAYRLLNECRRLGTLPFSIVARHAFIALAFLRSMVRAGILSEDDREKLLAHIPTVASGFARDMTAFRAGTLARGDLLERYGHLRPGTYNILSPSYAESPDVYLDGGPVTHTSPAPARAPGAGADGGAAARRILESRRAPIEAALSEQGFGAGFDDLAKFILEAIPAREAAKFEFTKNISLALGALRRAAARYDLSPDDLSFLTIDRLMQLAVETPCAAERTELSRIIGLYRKRHAITASIRLPLLIFDPHDVDDFTVATLHPNFVTRRRVIGPAVRLGAVGASAADLGGKLVLIENADPGYDWIFGQNIKGLITKYGGVASHMAIRAAEFQVPAAIGCGEVIFGGVERARVIDLDCEGESVRTIE